MKLWIVGVVLCFLTCVYGCAITTKEIILKPKEGANGTIELNDVASIIVVGDADKYVNVDVEDLLKAIVTLKNMKDKHHSTISTNNIAPLDVDLKLTCVDGSTSTEKLIITLDYYNLFDPELIEPTGSKEIEYTLPMPFPPNVDLSCINKIVIADWDMYNIDLNITLDHDNFNVIWEKNDDKGKLFEVSILATGMIENEVSFKMKVQDKPAGDTIESKTLYIPVNIKKDNDNSMLTFGKTAYTGKFYIDQNPINDVIIKAKINSNDAKINIKGNYMDCFIGNNIDGNVTVSSKYCSLPYDESFLSLELIAYVSGSSTTTSASLHIKILQKYFEKASYAGIFDNGKLDLKEIKLIGAREDVQIRVEPPDSKLTCSKTEDSVRNGDYVINCTIPNGFHSPLLEATIVAFKTEQNGEISTQVIINQLEATFKFDQIKYTGDFDIDRKPIDAITTAKINSKEILTFSISGEYNECFCAEHDNEIIHIKSKECTLPYGKTFLNLDLEAKMSVGSSATTALTSLFIRIHQKYFEKSSYFGTYDNGKLVLEKIKLIGAGDDVQIRVEPPDSKLNCSKNEDSCLNGDCIIDCNIANKFEDAILKSEVIAYKNDDAASKISMVVVIGNTKIATNIHPDDDEDNTGLIAAVAVLSVLLVGVLIAGALLYRRQKKSSQQLNSTIPKSSPSLSSRKSTGKVEPDTNSDNESIKITPRSSPNAGMERKVEFPPTEIPTITTLTNNDTADVDTSKLKFVKKPKPDSDSSSGMKYDRRATGYPLNPPSVTDLETLDYAPSEGSTLPAYSPLNKEDDLESVMTDATADTTKSVTFNKDVIHSILFEDIND